MSREEVKEMEFKAYKSATYRVIKELYGTNTTNCKTMLNKLEQCINPIQISNLLQWGRVNLL